MNYATMKTGRYPSGKPRWEVHARVAGERIRRYFIDEQQALAEKDRIERRSAEALAASDRLIYEAVECDRLLQKHGWTLRQATEWVLQHVVRFDNQPPLKQLVEEYLAEEKASGVAWATLVDLRHRLRKLAATLGNRKAHEVTSDEIRAWHSDMDKHEGLGARSRRHYLAKASQFFLWCVRNKKCAENPVAAVKRPKVIPGEVGFYSVEQCRHILAACAEHGLFHYMVLGLFPGIRPAELLRMHKEHVPLERRIIRLGADITKKTRRRVIEMPGDDTFGDCLMAWLSTMPVPERIFAGNQSTFNRHFRPMRDALGFKWIHDGLRHTAATYHFAYYGDVTKTAALLGEQDVRTLLEHYKGLATRAEAEEFYALRPGDLVAIPWRLEKRASVSGAPSRS